MGTWECWNTLEDDQAMWSGRHNFPQPVRSCGRNYGRPSSYSGEQVKGAKQYGAFLLSLHLELDLQDEPSGKVLESAQGKQ